jgi:hypothetical protein
MKSFKQFMSEAEGDFGSPAPKPKVKCYKVIKYAMAPGGKACAKRSSSSAGGDGA